MELTKEKVFATNPRCCSNNKIFLSIKRFHWIIVINKKGFISSGYISSVIISILDFSRLKLCFHAFFKIFLWVFNTILFDRAFWKLGKRQFSSKRWNLHSWSQLPKNQKENDNIKHRDLFPGWTHQSANWSVSRFHWIMYYCLFVHLGRIFVSKCKHWKTRI